jgi:hypothetical protein
MKRLRVELFLDWSFGVGSALLNILFVSALWSWSRLVLIVADGKM